MEKTVTKLWSILEKIVYFFLEKLYCILNKELSKESFSTFMQFVKFGIVGVSNAVISYGVYAICMCILKKYGLFVRTDYYIAQIVAFILSVLWSFYWNNGFVFKIKNGERRSLWRALLKTYIAYSFTGLFMNTIFLTLWINLIGISEFVAPIINIIINVPINFVINKVWAFKTA